MSAVPDRIDTAPLDHSVLSPQPFQEHLGWRITRFENRCCELELLIRPHHLNRNGIVHGGVLMSMLDSASGLAVAWEAGRDKPLPTVTVSLTCNFISAATSGRLIAMAKVDGGGGRIQSASATLTDQSGQLLATSLGSFRRFVTPP